MPQTLKDISDEYIYAGDFTEPKYYYEAVNDFQAAIKAWVKEQIIGEDESLEPWNENAPDAFDRNTYVLKRNRLRAELRTKLDAS